MALKDVASIKQLRDSDAPRLAKDFRARTELQHLALVVDRDAVGQGVGLLQVMSHEQRQQAELTSETRDLSAQCVAHRRVQRRKRLVQE